MDKIAGSLVLRLTQKVFDKNRIKRPGQIETKQKEPQLNEWFVDLLEMASPKIKLYVFIHPITFLLVAIHARNLKQATKLFSERLPAFLFRLGIEPRFYSDGIPSIDEALLLPTNDRSVLSRWQVLKATFQDTARDFEEDHPRNGFPLDVEKLCTVIENRMATYAISYSQLEFISSREKMTAYLSTEPGPINLVQAMRFEVTLVDVKPAISRVFQISKSSTFYELHHVLQALIGWENRHLFEFGVSGKVIYLPEINEYQSEWQELYDTKPLNCRDVRLTYFVQKIGTRFSYLYDPGDGWVHAITLIGYDEVLESDLPLCLSGTGGSAPEDSGGPHGLTMLLEALTDRKSEVYHQYKSWLGKTDPLTFDLTKTNKRLKNLHKIIKEFERAMPKQI